MSEYRLPSCINLSNDLKDFTQLVQNAKDWILFHGGGLRSRSNFSTYEIAVVPFTLLPSTFPEVEFKKAQELQPILNELMHNAANSDSFLIDVISSVAVVDEFTNRLFKIYLEIIQEEPAQSVYLGLFRSDYMTDYPDKIIKQVEFNTVAISFAGIATAVSQYHRFILERLGCFNQLEKLPQNNALTGLCEGLVEAWKLYNNERSVIVFVVEEVTYNICDQRFHEYEIYKQVPHLRVIRKTLIDIYNEGHLDNDKKLFIGKDEIAVVYYRTGYTPADYHNDNAWNARLMVERSMAIKCPSIQYHLVGTKKVQQVLTSVKWVKEFLHEDDQVERAMNLFTSIYSLDLNPEGDEAIEKGLFNPNQFVLKPQREGGGNNIYGEEVATKLKEMQNSEDRKSWILMKKINPPVQQNYIVKPESCCAPPNVDVISELGIFGVILGDKNKIYINKQVGHVLRSKPYGTDEGGVSLGAGCLDSPYLV